MNDHNLTPGPEGNQWAKKLPTPELRKIAYESYCAWLAKGKKKHSWVLKHPVRLSWETMEKYIKNYAQEFDLDLMKDAKAEGYGRWEQVIEDSAEGKNRKANPMSLAMIARNKLSWDKPDHRAQDNDQSAEQSLDKVMNQLANHQQQKADMATVASE